MNVPRRLDPERIADHLPRLFRSARAWTRTREEAEDLVQETCLRVLARPRLLRGEDELAYLLRAMHNTLVSQRRAAARRPQTEVFEDDGMIGARPEDDPEHIVEVNEVVGAISELPDDYRDALVAVDVAGLSYREAASALGIPEGTVTSRLYRARGRLARRLGGEQVAPTSAVEHKSGDAEANRIKLGGDELDRTQLGPTQPGRAERRQVERGRTQPDSSQ